MMSDPIEIRLDWINNEDRRLNLLIRGNRSSFVCSSVDQDDGLLQGPLVSKKNVQVLGEPIHGHVFNPSIDILV